MTRWPASSRRLVSAVHSPSRSSSTTTCAWTRVVPVPRRLGRSQAGERVNRKVRPPMLSRSTTRGSASGAAWSLRRCLAVCAVAGDLAVEGEADGVEHAGLAGAGVAGEQEQPTRREVVEVDRDGLDERTERGDLELVQPHQRAHHRVSRPRGRGPRGSSRRAVAQQRRTPSSSAGGAAHVRDEVERDLVGAACRRVVAGRRRDRAADGREAQGQGVREAARAAAPSPAPAAPRR